MSRNVKKAAEKLAKYNRREKIPAKKVKKLKRQIRGLKKAMKNKTREIVDQQMLAVENDLDMRRIMREVGDETED